MRANAQIESAQNLREGKEWRAVTRDNSTVFGWSASSRSSDPAGAAKIYEWLPENTFDNVNISVCSIKRLPRVRIIVNSAHGGEATPKEEKEWRKRRKGWSVCCVSKNL
ncbi:SpvB/TcaC N-terminal domain-containing protein [Paenibacillus amylolyticus]|uniref:SpvB/TcaC N-terminal domain-containing protein n=1 Tax=Paenibacillus amylolyticus TaxID=1451 RepID=UPI003BB1D55F